MKLLVAKCPTNYNVLSCGMDYSYTYTEDAYKFAYPINSSQCVCQDLKNSFYCYAVCTNAPLTNFEIVMTNSSGAMTAACSPGSNVLGCHIYPTKNSLAVDNFTYFYPDSTGSECKCKSSSGAACIATCASDIDDYNINMAYRTGTATTYCSNDTMTLGCGSDPTGDLTKDKFRSTYPQSNNCQCSDSYGTLCYAICGHV